MATDAPPTSSSPETNPYTVLLHSTSHSPSALTEAYATHRARRAATQLAALTSPTSPGLVPDPTLARLTSSPPNTDPSTIDPRHNLTIWARPPARVRTLVATLQARLLAALPGLYAPQGPHLHVTVLEAAHSLTAEQLRPLLEAMEASGAADAVADLPARLAKGGRTARLARPAVAFDAGGVALSFLPVANGAPTDEWSDDDGENVFGERPGQFGYHHLRGAAYAALAGAGIPVASRYVLPSAHVTIGRYLPGTAGADAVAALGAAVDAANAWLEGEVWGDRAAGGVWDVGEEKGLEVRAGSCWYGYGGRAVRVGRGIRSCTVRSLA